MSTDRGKKKNRGYPGEPGSEGGGWSGNDIAQILKTVKPGGSPIVWPVKPKTPEEEADHERHVKEMAAMMREDDEARRKSKP